MDLLGRRCGSHERETKPRKESEERLNLFVLNLRPSLEKVDEEEEEKDRDREKVKSHTRKQGF